jgi:cytidine deaminase
MSQSSTADADPRVRDALRDATEARDLAYAPYSGFKMGAAVVTDQNKVIKGSLVENISLGLSMCAERVALFSTIANTAGKPEILALVSRRTDGDLTWPCGACLQVALELGGKDLLLVVSDGRKQEIAKIGDIAAKLPHKS